MKVVKLASVLYKSLKILRMSGKSIGFVPTMGALHEGHLSLIRQARKENDTVVVSIFINPAQFGPKEDFRRYPHPLDNDLWLCKKEKADYVFLPGQKEMYGEAFSTYVNVESLSQTLCGKTRPGHFRGVATIVAKFFNIIQPNNAYFGQKDAQQAVIIKRMVEDLNIPVRIRIMPVVRQDCGLALSSRNTYLNNSQRESALVLYKALSLARLSVKSGQRDASRLKSRMSRLIRADKNTRIDYIDIVDAGNLNRLDKIRGACFILLAVYIGKTRLIDNILINA
ncbi:MAG: pantoate--beta-alanine ligase [Candidatus Omnitrophota bacterium]